MIYKVFSELFTLTSTIFLLLSPLSLSLSLSLSQSVSSRSLHPPLSLSSLSLFLFVIRLSFSLTAITDHILSYIRVVTWFVNLKFSLPCLCQFINCMPRKIRKWTASSNTNHFKAQPVELTVTAMQWYILNFSVMYRDSGPRFITNDSIIRSQKGNSDSANNVWVNDIKY